jgi:hypothetical protein
MTTEGKEVSVIIASSHPYCRLVFGTTGTRETMVVVYEEEREEERQRDEMGRATCNSVGCQAKDMNSGDIIVRLSDGGDIIMYPANHMSPRERGWPASLR